MAAQGNAQAPLERISKLDAARRQVTTAIRLYLEQKDTVSTYTRAAAAQTILHDLLTHEPPFQALILMDQSRLGRSTREIPYALGRIMDAAA